MSEMNRQEICAALRVSESTIRRLEHAGLPFTPVGSRSKRYDLAECKEWLRANGPVSTRVTPDRSLAERQKRVAEYTASFQKMKLRVMPSE